MRILVIGSTAQAAWLTSRLVQLNTTVQWWAESATASFTLQHGADSQTIQDLPLITNLDTALEVQPDWIVLATHGWQIDALAMQMLQKFPMGQYPKFLCLTHGIGSVVKLRTFFGENNVVRGVLGAKMYWQDSNLIIQGELGIVFNEGDLNQSMGSSCASRCVGRHR